MHVPIYVNGKTERALIDSGATGCFIDRSYVENNKLQTTLLVKPLRVRNVDNTENVAGMITEKVSVLFSLGKRTETQEFYVTELGKQSLILGLPWLVRTNPLIDWRTREVQFREGFSPPEDDSQMPTYNLAISFIKGEATEETRQQWNATKMNKAMLFAYDQSKEFLRWEEKTVAEKVPSELHE